LLLIHGAAGGAHIWLHQLKALSKDHRVIAVDLPGHGCSDELPPDQISITRYGRVVCDFIEALELTPTVLVGHSMGGAIAMWAALHAASRSTAPRCRDLRPPIAGLVLASTGLRLPVSDLVFQTLEHRFDDLGKLLASYAFSPQTPRELVQAWTNPPPRAEKQTVIADFRACDELDLRPRLEDLASLRLPTLLLQGKDDRMVSREQMHHLADRLTGGKLELLDRAGHMLFQEAPQLSSSKVLSFVDHHSL
jgi:4,5:9,10-diseco-3-hydroxy-5,9,17-trioxoandrosta-1(10),2-diene-4-oate hydrolase